MKIGVCGAGSFAACFIPLFRAHPLVESVALAEVFPDRRAEQAKRFGVEKTCDSLEALCASDVDAVAIFTQRWTHGPLAIQALRAGKHVYSAVPTAVTMAELQELVETVKSTGLIYMLGETSYYYPSTVYCRERFRKGDFGKFVYGEGEYYHDMSHGFYEAYQHSGGAEWRRHAGFPPMLYPTHSVSMILGVTGARMTRVSSLGYVDDHEDGVFRKGANLWDNPFSNETALFRSSDGGVCRINEFRRVGHWGNSVRQSLFGTEASYEEQANAQVWVTRQKEMTDLKDLLTCRTLKPEEAVGGTQADFYTSMAKVHRTERLPKEFIGQRNGHYGSHQFLADDFVKACVTGRLPPNHVWAAARYCAPGIVAHESSKQEGALMDVPDFGGPPADAKFLEE